MTNTASVRIVKRLRDIHYQLLDLDKYPIDSYKRRKLYLEKNALYNILLKDGVET